MQPTALVVETLHGAQGLCVQVGEEPPELRPENGSPALRPAVLLPGTRGTGAPSAQAASTPPLVRARAAAQRTRPAHPGDHGRVQDAQAEAEAPTVWFSHNLHVLEGLLPCLLSIATCRHIVSLRAVNQALPGTAMLLRAGQGPRCLISSALSAAPGCRKRASAHVDEIIEELLGRGDVELGALVLVKSLNVLEELDAIGRAGVVEVLGPFKGMLGLGRHVPVRGGLGRSVH